LFLNSNGLLLLHASLSDSIDILCLDVGFLVLNIEFLKKLGCCFDSTLKNNVFFLQVNLEFVNTSCSFSKFVETLVNILFFDVDTLVLESVDVLVHRDKREIRFWCDVNVTTHLL
jgi:hypothetical protein